eukprot:1416674-Pyramimonas_sp.AAC.1
MSGRALARRAREGRCRALRGRSRAPRAGARRRTRCRRQADGRVAHGVRDDRGALELHVVEDFCRGGRHVGAGGYVEVQELADDARLAI